MIEDDWAQQPGNVTSYLSDLLHSPVDGLEPLKGGDWSVAYGFKAGGRKLVARFGRHVDDFEKDRTASRLTTADMPVPEVLALEKTPDGHCCVSQRYFGVPLESLETESMAAIVPSVLKLWDALREADVSVWMGDLGCPEQTWPQQLLSVDDENERVFGWHDRMKVSPIGTEPYDRGLAKLKNMAPDCPEELHIQHNDLLHNNVLVQHGRISAVFDWGCAFLGDFLYDLAMFEFFKRWFPAMERIDWAGVARQHYKEIGLDVPDFDRRLRCYTIHVGLAGMAYCAFIGDDDELQRHADRLELL
ncbi:MAG TPA: aminoglycoside phosphotransferase family protein [Fimbriimonas sp.]|nr:aminoglycoside phosphotransferase family protein [Fimbriimonas sp.]